MFENFKKTKLALSKEKAKVASYQSVGSVPNAALVGSVGAAASSSGGAAITVSGSAQLQTLSTAPAAPTMQQPEVRPNSPYILQLAQQQQQADENEQQHQGIIELDDEEEAAPLMRSLVPSVSRLAEIDAVHSSALEVLER